MERSERLGHEPEQTHDKEFAPVNRGADARGRTRPDREDAPRRSGTGVPGLKDSKDTLPPDEEGVREAERTDDSR